MAMSVSREQWSRAASMIQRHTFARNESWESLWRGRFVCDSIIAHYNSRYLSDVNS